MANIIIGIHGLGNKPPKHILEKWWKCAIIEGLKTNNYKCRLPKFELVYWADIIYNQPLDIKQTDPNNPYYIEEKYVKGNIDFPKENHDSIKKIWDFLGRQLNKIFLNDDFSLNYSFISDALISKYFKDLELYYSEESSNPNDNRKVKDLIRNRLLNTLLKYKGHNIMLISHSMGSIVAFDVLTFLSTNINVNTFVTMGSPLGLPIVISKIAAEQKQRINGENHMLTPHTVFKNWYNFSDILDKVAFNYKLADDFSENSIGVKPVDFQVVNNYEINKVRNPHKSFGYLRTTEFSKVLYEYIISEKLSVFNVFARRATRFIDKLKTKKIE